MVEITPKPITVHIDVPTAKRIQTMATHLAAEYEGKKGKYETDKSNSLHSQIVGKIGEEAVARMFDLKKIEYLAWFRDHDMQAMSDLKLPGYHDRGVAIEVKTWVSSQWRDLGRAVRKNQYEDVFRKSDVLIWCTVGDKDFTTDSPFPAQIMGFNSLTEFDLSKKLFRDGNSYQVDLCLPMARFGAYLGDKRR